MAIQESGVTTPKEECPLQDKFLAKPVRRVGRLQRIRTPLSVVGHVLKKMRHSDREPHLYLTSPQTLQSLSVQNVHRYRNVIQPRSDAKSLSLVYYLR